MANWAKKLKRTVKELVGGKNTYMPKKKKSTDNVRTQNIKSGLVQAGLTQAEIKKLQGKK